MKANLSNLVDYINLRTAMKASYHEDADGFDYVTVEYTEEFSNEMRGQIKIALYDLVAIDDITREQIGLALAINSAEYAYAEELLVMLARLSIATRKLKQNSDAVTTGGHCDY